LCRTGRPRDFESFTRAGRTERFCFGAFLEVLGVLLFRFESKDYDFEESMSYSVPFCMGSYLIIKDTGWRKLRNVAELFLQVKNFFL
jgi:hypothetical protein